MTQNKALSCLLTRTSLSHAAIKAVNDWAISDRRFWEERFDKLDEVVTQMKKAEVGHDKKRGE